MHTVTKAYRSTIAAIILLAVTVVSIGLPSTRSNGPPSARSNSDGKVGTFTLQPRGSNGIRLYRMAYRMTLRRDGKIIDERVSVSREAHGEIVEHDMSVGDWEIELLPEQGKHFFYNARYATRTFPVTLEETASDTVDLGEVDLYENPRTIIVDITDNNGDRSPYWVRATCINSGCDRAIETYAIAGKAYLGLPEWDQNTYLIQAWASSGKQLTSWQKEFSLPMEQSVATLSAQVQPTTSQIHWTFQDRDGEPLNIPDRLGSFSCIEQNSKLYYQSVLQEGFSGSYSYLGEGTYDCEFEHTELAFDRATVEVTSGENISYTITAYPKTDRIDFSVFNGRDQSLIAGKRLKLTLHSLDHPDAEDISVSNSVFGTFQLPLLAKTSYQASIELPENPGDFFWQGPVTFSTADSGTVDLILQPFSAELQVTALDINGDAATTGVVHAEPEPGRGIGSVAAPIVNGEAYLSLFPEVSYRVSLLPSADAENASLPSQAESVKLSRGSRDTLELAFLKGERMLNLSLFEAHSGTAHQPPLDWAQCTLSGQDGTVFNGGGSNISEISFPVAQLISDKEYALDCYAHLLDADQPVKLEGFKVLTPEELKSPDQMNFETTATGNYIPPETYTLIPKEENYIKIGEGTIVVHVPNNVLTDEQYTKTDYLDLIIESGKGYPRSLGNYAIQTLHIRVVTEFGEVTNLNAPISVTFLGNDQRITQLNGEPTRIFGGSFDSAEGFWRMHALPQARSGDDRVKVQLMNTRSLWGALISLLNGESGGVENGNGENGPGTGGNLEEPGETSTTPEILEIKKYKKPGKKSSKKGKAKPRKQLFAITIQGNSADSGETSSYQAEIVVLPRNTMKLLAKQGKPVFQHSKKIRTYRFGSAEQLVSFTAKLPRSKKKWATVRVARAQDGKEISNTLTQ